MSHEEQGSWVADAAKDRQSDMQVVAWTEDQRLYVDVPNVFDVPYHERAMDAVMPEFALRLRRTVGEVESHVLHSPGQIEAEMREIDVDSYSGAAKAAQNVLGYLDTRIGLVNELIGITNDLETSEVRRLDLIRREGLKTERQIYNAEVDDFADRYLSGSETALDAVRGAFEINSRARKDTENARAHIRIWDQNLRPYIPTLHSYETLMAENEKSKADATRAIQEIEPQQQVLLKSILNINRSAKYMIHGEQLRYSHIDEETGDVVPIDANLKNQEALNDLNERHATEQHEMHAVGLDTLKRRALTGYDFTFSSDVDSYRLSTREKALAVKRYDGSIEEIRLLNDSKANQAALAVEAEVRTGLEHVIGEVLAPHSSLQPNAFARLRNNLLKEIESGNAVIPDADMLEDQLAALLSILKKQDGRVPLLVLTSCMDLAKQFAADRADELHDKSVAMMDEVHKENSRVSEVYRGTIAQYERNYNSQCDQIEANYEKARRQVVGGRNKIYAHLVGEREILIQRRAAVEEDYYALEVAVAAGKMAQDYVADYRAMSAGYNALATEHLGIATTLTPRKQVNEGQPSNRYSEFGETFARRTEAAFEGLVREAAAALIQPLTDRQESMNASAHQAEVLEGRSVRRANNAVENLKTHFHGIGTFGLRGVQTVVEYYEALQVNYPDLAALILPPSLKYEPKYSAEAQTKTGHREEGRGKNGGFGGLARRLIELARWT